MRKQAKASPSPAAGGRVERSKEAVMKATLQLMSEEGLSGVSVDTVSRRSKVAKTTIYRHWPSRSALLLEACSALGARAQVGRSEKVPDTGSLEGDLMALAQDLARRLRTAKWAIILPSIIDAAERDPDIAGLHAKMHAGFMEGFRTVIERAEHSGNLPDGKTLSGLIAAIAGPLFYRRWFSREPLNEPFVKSVVETALGRDS